MSIEAILDYLNFDNSLLTHLEATYHQKRLLYDKTQEELEQFIKTIPLIREPPLSIESTSALSEPTLTENHTIEDYNKWRSERLAISSVSEKLKWNQVRRSILERTSIDPSKLPPSMPIPTSMSTPMPLSKDKCKPIEELLELLKKSSSKRQELDEILTEMVNYRAMINVANSIRALIGGQL